MLRIAMEDRHDVAAQIYEGSFDTERRDVNANCETPVRVYREPGRRHAATFGAFSLRDDETVFLQLAHDCGNCLDGEAYRGGDICPRNRSMATDQLQDDALVEWPSLLLVCPLQHRRALRTPPELQGKANSSNGFHK